MTTPAVRYPAGEITPHGWYHLVNGTRPTMWLDSWDESVRIDLMGGYAPPFHDPAFPEAVALRSLKGLIAPWKHITQKGATEDGVTQIDALYDPIEVEAVVECIGRDYIHLSRVVRDLIASIDAKQQSTLNFITHDMGHWWAPIRWYQGAPPNPLANPQTRRQQMPLRMLADNGFWRTYDDTDSFGFGYESTRDNFEVNYANTAGPNWPLRFYNGAAGYVHVANGRLGWVDVGNGGRSLIFGPRKDFHTATNNQVVTIKLGSFQELTFPDGAENAVGARMNRNPDGTWAGDGVVAFFGGFGLRLSRFNNFVETPMRTVPQLLPPLPNDELTLVAGFEGDEQRFHVLRNGIPVLKHKEPATSLAARGPDHRGVGGGMRAGAALITQATPAALHNIRAGDNSTVSQSGFLRRVNIGDQPMCDDYTLFGPGKFKLYDGPESEDYVEFGPLLTNQIVLLRTDPRNNTTLVQDLTVTPATPQQLDNFQDAMNKFLSFAGMNGSALGDQIKSMFGIRPPQGNLYKYFKGRFSDNAAIPPKSPGRPAEPYFVKVAIDDGNAESRVIASGTPLRRYPL